MISKRFSTSKKASKFSKRVLGMESLESRELLSINPLGYDGSDVVQTANTSQDFGTEAAGATVTVSNLETNAAGQFSFTLTQTATDYYLVQYRSNTTGPDNWIDATVTGASGQFVSGTPVNITLTGLTAGTPVDIRVITQDDAAPSTNKDKDTDPSWTATSIATNKDPDGSDGTSTPAGPAVTNSTTSTSGVTTNATTITWTKPTSYTGGSDPVALKGAGNYTLTITGGSGGPITIDAATIKAKTSWAVTGLEAGVSYTYTVTAELTKKNDSDTVPTGQQVVASGTFATEALNDAAKVTVGPSTDVKVAFTAKTSTYKVTWKAPANYTGGYKVIFNDGTTDVKVVDIKPGDKLQAEVAVSDLTANKQHSITVVADVDATVGAAIASTPTFINVGTVPPVAATAPDTVLAANVASSALTETNISNGTKIDITGVTDTSSNKIIGYYVATGATDPGTTDLSKYVYVARNSASDTAVTSINLISAGANVYVYGVGADGTLSAAAATTTVTATTALTATDSTADFATKPAAKADTTTKNKVVVSWTAGADIVPETPATNDVKYEIQGYNVSYRIKGSDNWISAGYVTGKTTTTIAAIENLAWATEYEFKVDTVVLKSTTTDGGTTWTPDSANTVTSAAKSVIASLKTAAAPTVAAPGKVEIDTINTGTSMQVKWGAATGANSYVVTLKDANKAVLATFTVSTTSILFTEAASPSAAGELDFSLTPGMKYTVEVQAIGTTPGTLSKASSATLTAAAYPVATVKDAKATTITDISVTITEGKNVVAGSQYYYVEYTSVVDAKGKPDWNAAEVVSYTATETITGNFAAGDPKAFTTGTTVKIEGLNPGTQYFVRVVAVDNAITSDPTGSGASAVTWDDVTRVATGKEAKIKTTAVPLATISKSGFAMNVDEFGFKFTGKDAAENDKKSLLKTGTTFTYTLLVSEVATVNKATGKLNGAQEIDAGSFIMTSGTDAKGNPIITSRIVTFSELVTNLNLKLDNLKTLNFQLEVTYADTNGDYAVTYTKVSKLTLPKWFA